MFIASRLKEYSNCPACVAVPIPVWNPTLSAVPLSVEAGSHWLNMPFASPVPFERTHTEIVNAVPEIGRLPE